MSDQPDRPTDFSVGDRVSIFVGRERRYLGEDSIRKRHRNGNWLMENSKQQWQGQGSYLSATSGGRSWPNMNMAWPTASRRAVNLREQSLRRSIVEQIRSFRYFDQVSTTDLLRIKEILDTGLSEPSTAPAATQEVSK